MAQVTCWFVVGCLFCANAFGTEAPAPAPRPATLVWTGGGTDALWTNPENWSPRRVPTENDDVVLDATSDKPSTFNPVAGQGREAKGLTVRSLTVAPEYAGVLRFRSPGRITGSARLAGRIELEFDAHVLLRVEGADLDLSRVTQLKCRFAGGSFGLAGPIVQTLTPPADPAILLPGVVKLGGGTLKLAGPFNGIMLNVDSKSALDLNGHDVTTKLLQIAGPIQNLGGRTLTVTGAVGYTINAIGFMRDGGNAVKPLDLAPGKPWKLQVKREKLLVLYGPREEWEFHFQNCKIGNCDASTSQVQIRGEKGSTDAGGNQGIDFNPGPLPPPPPASAPATRPAPASGPQPAPTGKEPQ